MAVDRWFRFYEEAINHDKVQSLPSDALRWQWTVLLAVNSKYGGEIPSLEIARINLRVTSAKAATIIATLAKAELLDPVQGGYFKARNWTKRQPIDATASERMRRYRQNQRNDRNDAPVTTVTVDGPVTPTELRAKTDDDGDAGARPLISDSAKRLSDEVTKIAGHDLEFVPPSWFGAPYRAQRWLNQGWPEELILISVREQAAKKRDGPANSIRYFEPGIATAIARQNQPLPVGNVTEIPRNDRNGSTTKSGLAAIDRIFDRIESRPGISAPADENAVLSLSARSIP